VFLKISWRKPVETRNPSSTCESLILKSQHGSWDLQPLFHPRSVAVIGVSPEKDRHPDNVIFNKIHLRYPVDVFPVNLLGGTLLGQNVYTGIDAIPQKVDLAIIAVRAEHMPDILDACIRSGAGGATIISEGFAEVGQRELNDISKLAKR
jgi:acyl-CoA synthetase (NDP forming)